MEYAFKYVLQTIKFQERGISFEKNGGFTISPYAIGIPSQQQLYKTS